MRDWFWQWVISLVHLVYVSQVWDGQNPFDIFFLGFVHENLIGRFPQFSSIFRRKGPIANLYKIIIQGSVGSLWRADGHDGKVQVVDRAGGDRGSPRRLLPLLVRLADQQSCSQKTKADHTSPEDFEGPGLIGKIESCADSYTWSNNKSTLKKSSKFRQKKWICSYKEVCQMNLV